MGVYAAWDGNQYVVRGNFDPEQARAIADLLRDRGMEKEANDWSLAADAVEEGTRELEAMQAARDRVLRQHLPTTEGQ